MHTKKIIGLLLLLVSGFFSCSPEETVTKEPIRFVVPDGFPKPVYDFSANPITEAGFELGRQLFYDPILSVDNSISCSDCHLQSHGFAHRAHPRSHGIKDRFTFRNSLPVQNLAWKKDFFWIGGVKHLDNFAPSPIEDTNEMGEKVATVIRKLQQKTSYQEAFQKAFNSEVNTDGFLKALAQFQLMCISANSNYDQFLAGKYQLTKTENEGKKTFEQKCASCHSGVLFSNQKFTQNGIESLNPEDLGRYLITGKNEDKYAYIVPSLRNVALTAPYMHDGQVRNLQGVMEHYANNSLLKITLNKTEQANLIAFLKTLTDESFITNPILSAP